MTDAELALLSLLLNDPKSDDVLHSLIEERGLRRWTAIGVASMYYVLDKLERQGLVKSLPENLPARRWQITSAGYAVLQTAVADLLSTPHTHGRGLELGLASLNVLKTSQTRAALENYQQELRVRIRRSRKEQSDELAGNSQFQTNALYSHHIAMLEAELAWMEQFTVQWEAQAIPDPPEPIMPLVPIPRVQQVVLPEDPDSVHKRTTMEGDFRKRTRRTPSSPKQ